MTGMGADRCLDDMKGLLQGLRNCARYNQIIFHLSERFLLPPDNLDERLTLAKFDDHLIAEARKDPPALRSKILRESPQNYPTLFIAEARKDPPALRSKILRESPQNYPTLFIMTYML